MTADVSCRLLEVDFCVAPESKILKSDLTWAAAAEIKPGDELIGFDEDLKARTHSFRRTTVTAVRTIWRSRIRVRTTHGDTVVASDHPFVARLKKYNRKWRRAKDLRPGMLMAFLAEPWTVDQSRDAGYLAGFFDGEGWVSPSRVGFGQNRGETLDYVKRLLAERSIPFSQYNGSSTAQCELSDGMRAALRFLGMIRPPRLLNKAALVWENRRTWGKRTPIVSVLSVEYIEDGPVVAIETTTKTFISDGFFSHNSGIEAVLVGRFLWSHGFGSAGAKQYIRLARCGIHAAVTARAVDRPVDLTLADDDLKSQLDAVKEAYPVQYDLSKRTVHAKNFGMSTYGQVEKFPEYFPTLAVADRFERFYFDLAPDLPKWHQALRKQAREHGYLGGVAQASSPSIWGHPYGYKHWFWDVLSYQPCQEFTARKWLKDPARAHRIIYLHGRPFRVQLGGDGNRVIAFYPQSTAAGRLKEVELDLFLPESPSYIGDCYFGRTPLLGPIHDSLLLHVPNRCFDRVAEIVIKVMQQPSGYLPIPREWNWGPFLPIGVSAKTGKNWMAMEKLKVPAWQWVVPSAGEDPPVLPRESEGDEDDWSALKRAVA